MDSAKLRTQFLDFLRIIACFCVIVNHTNSDIFLSRTPQELTWFFSLGYFFISKIAVPIFFMISGYLLLNKTDTWGKTFSRLTRIIIALVGCAFIYAIYRSAISPEFSIKAVLDDVLKVYIKNPSNALWYLYAYIGILLMLPFLQKLCAAMDKKDFHIFFIISGLFSGLMPILIHYKPTFQYNGNFYIPLFGSYILMLFIGQYFARFEINKTLLGFFIALSLFLLILAFNITATYYEFLKSNTSYLFFDNRSFITIVLQSVCVFYMASFLKLPEKVGKIVSYIGACTFGIYLISDLFIAIFKPYYRMLAEVMHPLIAVVIFEIVVFVCGLIVTAILKRIPKINKIV